MHAIVSWTIVIEVSRWVFKSRHKYRSNLISVTTDMGDYQLKLPTGILKTMNLLETFSTYFSSKNSESRRHLQIVMLLFWGKTEPSRVKRKRKMILESDDIQIYRYSILFWLSLSLVFPIQALKAFRH